MDETLAVSLNCLLHKLFKSQSTFSVMVICRKSRLHFFWLFTEFLFNCINLNLILDVPLGREGLEWDSEVPEASSNKGKQSRDIVQYLSVWSSGPRVLVFQRRVRQSGGSLINWYSICNQEHSSLLAGKFKPICFTDFIEPQPQLSNQLFMLLTTWSPTRYDLGWI